MRGVLPSLFPFPPSLVTDLGIWQLFGFFFLPAIVRVHVCEEKDFLGGNGEEGRRIHFQGQKLGSSFPKVTQTHHSNNSCCNFIFISLKK